MALNDKKHMDVAKPGSIKIQTGSKPMVVGHQPVENDPTIMPENDTKESGAVPSRSKVKITPLTDAEKSDSTPEETPDKPVEAVSEKTAASTEKPEAESVKVEEPQKTDEKEVAPKEVAPEDKVEQKPKSDTKVTASEAAAEKVDADQDSTSQVVESKEDSAIAHEERLQEVIASKEFFIPIKEHNSGGMHTFIVAFMITLLIAAVVVLALLDANVIDLGITPPTDFL